MGYLMITDGQNTLGMDPKQSVTDVSIPIFSLGVGDKSALVDISIKSVDAPNVAVKNEIIEILNKKGLSLILAITFGRSFTTLLSLVPFPPASIIAQRSSLLSIRKAIFTNYRISFNQLLYPII